MLMNNQISFSTDGIDEYKKSGIHFSKFTSRMTNRESEIHTGQLNIGDTTITIHFFDQKEIIEFCQKHNIDYLDQRDIED